MKSSRNLCYHTTMEKFIIDTNLFFNMQSGLGLGDKTEKVVIKFTKGAQKLKNDGAQIYVPPRVVEEFLGFFENKDQPFIHDFLSVVVVKAPDTHTPSFSAQLFYKLVEDVRLRSYRGLRIGEEEIESAASHMLNKNDLDKKTFQQEIGAFIKKFRERYRNATRFGFLDSLADLDLIVLAKEQDGNLVSSDEGVVAWGRMFGVKEVSPAAFGKRLAMDERE